MIFVKNKMFSCQRQLSTTERRHRDLGEIVLHGPGQTLEENQQRLERTAGLAEPQFGQPGQEAHPDSD